MFRYRLALAIVLTVLVTALEGACGRRADGLGSAGRAALASDPPAADPPASRVDTEGVVTRRVLAGPNVTAVVSPSPDGNSLAEYMPVTGDIGVRDLATGRLRPLTHNTTPYDPGIGLFPLFSPDGRRVVYGWEDFHERPFDWRLRFVSADGGKPRELYDQKGTDWIQAEDWSPDGRWILALRERLDGMSQIVLVSASDGRVRPLETLDWRAPGTMKFSPDGRWIYYDFPPSKNSGRRDIYALAADGSRKVGLVEGPSDDRLMGVSPGGEQLLFLSDRSGAPGAWVLPIHGGEATGAPILVKPDLWRALPLGFARDGRYFYGVDVADPDVYVATFDAGTGSFGRGRSLRTPGPGRRGHPAWSPDGRFLAYTLLRFPSESSTRSIIVVRSLETGAIRELPPLRDVATIRDLSWEPDGRSLLALGRDRKGRSAVLRVDVQTGAGERLLEAPRGDGMQRVLSMGGDSLLYTSFRRGAGGSEESWIAILHPASGRDRRVYRAAAGAPQVGPILALAPSGQRLAFTVESPGNTQSLEVLDLGSGRVRAVQDGLRWRRSVTWIDAHTLLVAAKASDDPKDAGERVFRVDLGGGRAAPLGLVMDGLSQIRLAPGGDRFAFVAGMGKREIWEMSGLPVDAADSSEAQDGNEP